MQLSACNENDLFLALVSDFLCTSSSLADLELHDKTEDSLVHKCNDSRVSRDERDVD